MAKIILLNKPFNVLCQFTDKEGRPTLADFVDTNGVYPAGRLDYDSEGLVVLTDNGKLQHQISHPDAKSSKTYWVQVEGTPNHVDLEPLHKGIQLKDGLCRPAKATLIKEPDIWPRNPPVRERASIPTTWLELTISEGRNRQVRRMTAAIGFPTLRLIRATVGDWSIDNLKPGESKQLTIHTPANNSQRPRRSTRGNRRL
ncbi:MAG: pseudouridine synthase [Oceanicoccus sp.]|uniref:pseudouridine synthase n=1 Tax=Oceanicoccus sp. TaxID=2691044 RepID=UPI00262658A0|nr:pseudouridine synthase [Oceanicoccus sp.]MCP3908475.1 pseudouridine synthase [Oceanicoccus sp.]MDG1773336.1 pseudouridine synthase [Oceanicoccus sp.]